MAVDQARVAMVFAAGPAGATNGSGYAVGERLILTAAHVFSQAGLSVNDRAEVHLLGSESWVPGTVSWLDADLDAALLRVDQTAPWPATEMSALRWGALAGAEPVYAAATGFPWSQQRPDGIRDTEHAVGFVPPGTGVQTGSLHLSVLSSAPLPRSGGGSPWAGMSGAALVVGPHLVGVVVVDPAKFDNDRLVVVPVTRLLANPVFAAALGDPVAEPVGGRWRLEYATGRSVTLAPPYRSLPAGLDVAAAPHQLLFPEYGVVPFVGREDIVAELAYWCTERRRAELAVRTITGGGGSGKTRLAAQTCLRMSEAGFYAGFADANTPGGALRCLLDRPTLLVVDNADLNVNLVADLVTALAYTDVPVRLLLVARSRAPWWRFVQTRTEHQVDGFDHGDVPLAKHTMGRSARAQQYAAALNALAAVLPPPIPAAPAASPDLGGSAFADPLMVNLAALLVASGETLDSSPRSEVSVQTRVLRAFLDREAARWPTQVADQESSQISAEVLRRSVAVATIAAPADEGSGSTTLTAVPDLADETATRRVLSRWLHTLNPGPDYWNPLRPDPLADQLLADLDLLPEVAMTVTEQAIQRADHPTLYRMLIELTRAAAANTGAATAALSRILHEQLGDLLDAALGDPEGPLPQHLTAALNQQPVPAAAAHQVRRLPKHSLSLRDLAATLGEQTVTHYRHLANDDPTAHRIDLAQALTNQSVSLGAIGQNESALDAATEAAKIFFEFRETRPDALPAIASALINQSNASAALGRREDALRATTLAVNVYRTLATAMPGSFRAELATALNNQHNALTELGQWEEALAAITEAVKIRRQLTANDPDTFRPDLAMSLSNQSTAFGKLARGQEAVAAVAEAVDIYRELTAVDPDAFRHGLAMALNNQCLELGRVNQLEGALAAGTEAVEICRNLAETRPDVFRLQLAMVLQNQSTTFGALDRLQDALAAVTECAEIRRELAITRPDAIRPHLARALNILARVLLSLGRREEALRAVEEGVAIYRELATALPDAFRPELGKALNYNFIVLVAVGRHQEALTAVSEEVETYRELVGVLPDVFRPELAMALSNQSNALWVADRREEALTAVSEAIEIYRELFAVEPDGFRSDLVNALRALSNAYFQLGRFAEAQAVAAEAESIS